MPDPLPIAKNRDTELCLLPALANRHGLITGATGTGKTVTLQVMAERFSQIGVPVFMADVKGDLSGITQPGAPSPKLAERAEAASAPTSPPFAGLPGRLLGRLRRTGSSGPRDRSRTSGPLLLSRILNLNETQAGVLALVFKVADDNGLLLLDLKDLRAMLQHVGDHAQELQTNYGNVSGRERSARSSAACSRSSSRAADEFIGEPMLERRRPAADRRRRPRRRQHPRRRQAACSSPTLYSTLLLWLLSELYERLPEVGDRDKPKLVFFFDEAHLLFTDAPKALLDKIEQVVRLIRSKGVGVYFVTQNPLDVPETVLGQLGNRVQHALRAFTPRDQKAVKAAAETMRANPEARHRKGDHRARRRRSAGVVPRREGTAGDRRARVRPAARRPDRPGNAGGAARRHRRHPVPGGVRQGGRPRIGVRATQRTRGGHSTCTASALRHGAGGRLDGFDQGFARRAPVRQRAQGQHRRSRGEERRANDRIDSRARDRPGRTGLAARQRAPLDASGFPEQALIDHRRARVAVILPRERWKQPHVR